MFITESLPDFDHARIWTRIFIISLLSVLLSQFAPVLNLLTDVNFLRGIYKCKRLPRVMQHWQQAVNQNKRCHLAYYKQIYLLTYSDIVTVKCRDLAYFNYQRRKLQTQCSDMQTGHDHHFSKVPFPLGLVVRQHSYDVFPTRTEKCLSNYLLDDRSSQTYRKIDCVTRKDVFEHML